MAIMVGRLPGKPDILLSNRFGVGTGLLIQEMDLRTNAEANLAMTQEREEELVESASENSDDLTSPNPLLIQEGEMNPGDLSAANNNDYYTETNEIRMATGTDGPLRPWNEMDPYPEGSLDDLRHRAMEEDTDKAGDAPGIIKAATHTLDHFQREYPQAVSAAQLAGLTPDQIVTFFGQIVEKAGRNVSSAFKALPSALKVAWETGLTPCQITTLFGQVAEKTENLTSYAFQALPLVLRPAP